MIILNKNLNQNYNNIIQHAQKKTVGLIGNSCDTEIISNLVQWLETSGNNDWSITQQNFYQHINIPIYYRSSILFQRIKDITSLLILGNFPRFETANMNLHLRKIARNYESTLKVVGCFNNHNYSVDNLGTSFKTFINIFGNKHFLVKYFLKKHKLLIVSSGFFNYTNKQVNNAFYNQFFMKKFFSFINDYNQYSLITSNTSPNILAELGFLPNPKSSLFFRSKQKNHPKKLHFNEIWGVNLEKLENLNIKSKDLILFTTHNINTINLEVDNNFYLLPITSHFETTNTLMNIEGKVQKGYKATSKSKMQTKHFSNIIETFSNLQDEYWDFLQKNHNLFYLEKNSLGEVDPDFDYEDFSIFRKRLNPFSSKKHQFSFFYNFLDNQVFLNYFLFHKNKYLFSFFYLFFLPKTFNIKTKIFNFKNNIQNFYQTDLVTKNSHVMSLTTFFTLNNPHMPVKK